jgi:hypothetical protein
MGVKIEATTQRNSFKLQMGDGQSVSQMLKLVALLDWQYLRRLVSRDPLLGTHLVLFFRMIMVEGLQIVKMGEL